MDARNSRDSWKILKIVKQQHAGRPATAGTLLISVGTSWMSTAAGPPESDSRDVSNGSRISPLKHYQSLGEHQQSKRTKQTSTAKGRPRTAGSQQQ
jgi:hypothetical protein